MGTPNEYSSLAFICYSRRDVRRARQLQADLEGYRVPTSVGCDRRILQRGGYVRPILLDHTDVNVKNEPFWPEVEDRLAGARYLIVLCSVDAARSKSVEREIQIFLRSHDNRTDLILPVILNGSIREKDGEFRCLPDALLPYLEVLVGRNLPTDEGCSRTEVQLKVISWLIQVEYSVVFEKHRYRKARQSAIAAVAALVVLASMAGLAFYAWRQSRSATTATAQVATSRTLAATSDYIANLRLAGQNIASGKFTEARAALERCDPAMRDWEWGYMNTEAIGSVSSFEVDPAPQGAAVSPDGHWLALCTSEGISVVNLSVPETLPILLDAISQPRAVVWSPNSQLVAAGTSTGDFGIWTLPTGIRLVTAHLEGSPSVGQLAFDASGTRVWAASSGGAILTFDAMTGQAFGPPMITVNPAGRFVVSPDGSRLVAIDVDGRRISVFDARSNRLEWSLTPEGRSDFTDMCFSGDSRRLLISSDGEGSWLADSSSGRVITRVGAPDAHVGHGQFCSNGSFVCLGHTDGTVEFYTFFPFVDKVTPLHSTRAHSGGVTALKSLDYDMVMTGGGDGIVEIWIAHTGQSLARFRGHAGGICGLAQIGPGIAQDSVKESVLSWSADSTARTWSLSQSGSILDLQYTVPLQRLRWNSGQTAYVLNDDRQLMVGVRSGSTSGAPVIKRSDGTTIAVLEQGRPITCATWAPSGDTVITATDEPVIRMWSANEGVLVRELRGHSLPVTAINCSRSAQAAITGSSDGTARVWNLAAGTQTAVFPHVEKEVTSVQLNSLASMAASAVPTGEVFLWSVSTGALAHELHGLKSSPHSLVFSEDGRLLAGASVAIAAVWDVSTGRTLQQFDCGSPVSSVSISPSGSRVLALTGDGVLDVWDTRSGMLVSQFTCVVRGKPSMRFLDGGSNVLISGDNGELFVLLGSRAGEHHVSSTVGSGKR